MAKTVAESGSDEHTMGLATQDRHCSQNASENLAGWTLGNKVHSKSGLSENTISTIATSTLNEAKALSRRHYRNYTN